MQVSISPSDISLSAMQGVDIHRFLDILMAVDSPDFTSCQVNSCFGLLVFQFHGPNGHTTCATGFALLELTKDLVVADDGSFVDRYAKIIEELLKRATDKLSLPLEARELKRDSILAVAH